MQRRRDCFAARILQLETIGSAANPAMDEVVGVLIDLVGQVGSIEPGDGETSGRVLEPTPHQREPTSAPHHQTHVAQPALECMVALVARAGDGGDRPPVFVAKRQVTQQGADIDHPGRGQLALPRRADAFDMAQGLAEI